MRRPLHRQRTRPNHERWLVSYADFITLLFAFFVVLYATSQGDQKRAARVSGAIEQAFRDLGLSVRSGTTSIPQSAVPQMRALGSTGGATIQPQVLLFPQSPSAAQRSAIESDLHQRLSLEFDEGTITVRSIPEGLVVSLHEVGFFETGSSRMRTSSQPAFARLADYLRDRRCRLRVEGHTDPVPIHNAQFASNWELSTARATDIVQRLITAHRYPPEDLSAGGYAEYHPVADNNTPSGRAQNRRVDLVIRSVGAELHP